MPLQIDDKGKYFTERINKRGLLVTLSVRGNRVQGTVHLAPDHRLKDEMNNDEQFIALTDAKLWDSTAMQIFRETNLIIVNKTQVDWIYPDEPESAPKDN